MADNKVNFLRGTSAEYEASAKDNDIFYYTTDDEKLYLGNKEITGGSITIDNTLSDTSKNPVQNKVITNALNVKANLTDIPTSLPANGGNADTVNNHTVKSDVPENAVFTDTKVTSVDNHYEPIGNITTSASGGTLTDISKSSSGVQVVTGVIKDEAGHVTGVTSAALKSTNDTYGVATSSTLGLVKSGTDITVAKDGNVSVNDNSHKHTVSNISDLTATAAELNVLDGITATTTELNYTDGVTSNIQTQLNTKAPIASPTFTGTPKAPTASAGTNTTQIATTAFVQTAVSNGLAASDAMIIKGTIGTGGTVTALPTTYKTGWTYRVVTNGTYAGQVCEIGDLIIALVDRNGSGNVDSDWCVAQTNINGAITGIKSGDAYIGVSQSGSVVTFTHKDVDRSNTTSTEKPSQGGTFTAVKSVTSDSKGHITGVDTETVTIPVHNAFSNVKVGSTTIASDTTTDTIEIAGSNVTLTPDATNDKLTIGITKANVTSALGYTPPTADTDRYVNKAAFSDDSANTAASPVKMTLTRAGSDTATVVGNIPKVSSSSAGVVPKGAAVSSQTTSTKFLREDGTWAAPSYIANTDTKVAQNNSTSNSDYRLLLSYSADDTNTTNTSYKSTNFKANPSTGALYAKGYDRYNITGQTLDVNTLTLSAGSPHTMHCIEKTAGGAANITNIPLTGQPFILDVELIRWGSTTDYITLQTFTSISDANNIYRRWCNSGTWRSWSKFVGDHTHVSADITDRIITTKVDDLNWGTVDKKAIPTISTIAFWNGAFEDNNASNLKYCSKGEFGDMATKSSSNYYTNTDLRLRAPKSLTTTNAEDFVMLYIDSVNGNDNNSGTNTSSPLKTFNAAVLKYKGDRELRIYLRDGTYTFPDYLADFNAIRIIGSSSGSTANSDPSKVTFTNRCVIGRCLTLYMEGVTIAPTSASSFAANIYAVALVKIYNCVITSPSNSISGLYLLTVANCDLCNLEINNADKALNFSGATAYVSALKSTTACTKSLNLSHGSIVNVAGGLPSINTQEYTLQDGASRLTIDGVDVTTTANNVVTASCTTAAATQVKVITLDDSRYTLKDNDILGVKFTYTNSYRSTTDNPITFSIGGVSYRVYRDETTLASGTDLQSFGKGGRSIYYRVDSTNHILIQIFHSWDDNTTYTPQSLGFGYGTCTTAETDTAKVATLSGYNLVTNGIVSIKFSYNVPASSTLNINSKGAKAIYNRGSAITSGIILSGDIATFIYNGSQYHLIAVDNPNAQAARKLTSAHTIDGVSFNGTGGVIHYATCSTAAATAAKVVSLTGFTLATGAKIAVKFTVTNTAANPTLNVNGTGAKAIYYRGAAISAGYLAANRTYEFIYNGTQYELVGDLDTNSDTHWTSKNIVGASNTATANAAATNGNVYLNHLENSSVKSAHNIVGSGATTVTSDANGKITISSNNTDTKVTNTLATTTKAYVTGTTSATTNTGTQVFDTGVYLDTTAGQLVATTFKGNLNGNASTATSATNSDKVDGKHAADFALSSNPSIEGEIRLLRQGNSTTIPTIFAWEDTIRIRNTLDESSNPTYTDFIVKPDGIYTEGMVSGSYIPRTKINDGGNADTLDGYHADTLMKPSYNIPISDNYINARVISDSNGKNIYREYIREKADSSATEMFLRLFTPGASGYSDLRATGTSSGVIWNFFGAKDVQIGGKSVLTSGMTYVSGKVSCPNVDMTIAAIATVTLGFKPSCIIAAVKSFDSSENLKTTTIMINDDDAQLLYGQSHSVAIAKTSTGFTANFGMGQIRLSSFYYIAFK